MGGILEFLKGKKTYIVAAGFVVYELLGLYLNGQPINVQVIATALIGATMRAGMANLPGKTADKVEAKVEAQVEQKVEQRLP